jgi:hypothetical protein
VEEEGEELEDFEDATRRHRRYLFLVVEPRPFASSTVAQTLTSDLQDFGRSLGRDGSVVRVSPELANGQLARIAAMAWPAEIGRRLSDAVDPALLVLARDFEGFDPREHPWALIWLAEHERSGLHRLFTRLARLARRPDVDLLEELRREQRRAVAEGTTRAAFEAIEVKPSIFGISVDVRALVRALGR